MDRPPALQQIPGEFAICRRPANAEWPKWAAGPFCSVTRSADELSVIMARQHFPADIAEQGGYALFRISGTLPLEAVGVLAGISTVLADAGISVLCVGTYDTDYFLIREVDTVKAREVLTAAGYVLDG